jgi:hypothetical protein
MIDLSIELEGVRVTSRAPRYLSGHYLLRQHHAGSIEQPNALEVGRQVAYIF